MVAEKASAAEDASVADEASQERMRALVRGLEAALAETIPGLRVVERELALGNDGVADLVAVDEAGRIVLVLVVDGLADETCLAALDLLAHARANARLLARHLADPLARADLDPRVLLVAESFAERLKTRLAPLFDDRLTLLEIRSVSSARGSATYLVPVEAAPAAGEPRASVIEDFLQGLAPAERALASDGVRRLRRLDPALECSVTRAEAQWRHRGRLLCALRRNDGGLEGLLPERAEPAALAQPADLESFVERALERYLALAGADPLGDADDLPARDLAPPATSPILTPEEIRAFHE